MQPRTVPAQRQLIYGAEAKDIAESKINKDMYISVMLQDLHKEGLLKADVWKDISEFPNQYSEKSLVSYMLELVEVVLSGDERNILSDLNTTKENLATTAKAVETKCMKKMLEYEGVDPEIEAQLRKNSGDQKKATYLAVGRRVRNYKKELKQLKNLPSGTEMKDIPLQDRPPQQQQGTPPGQHSILRMFSRTTNN